MDMTNKPADLWPQNLPSSGSSIWYFELPCLYELWKTNTVCSRSSSCWKG